MLYLNLAPKSHTYLSYNLAINLSITSKLHTQVLHLSVIPKSITHVRYLSLLPTSDISYTLVFYLNVIPKS